MQHIDIRKKRPSRWPWIAGAVVLLLVLWGVTTLLRSEAPEEAEATGPTVEDADPPAAIPTPPQEAGSAGPISSGSDVLRVDSRREARRGETLVVSGTLQRADPDKTDRMTSILERSPGSEGWTVVRALKLVEDPGAPGAPADRALSAG